MASNAENISIWWRHHVYGWMITPHMKWLIGDLTMFSSSVHLLQIIHVSSLSSHDITFHFMKYNNDIFLIVDIFIFVVIVYVGQIEMYNNVLGNIKLTAGSAERCSHRWLTHTLARTHTYTYASAHRWMGHGWVLCTLDKTKGEKFLPRTESLLRWLCDITKKSFWRMGHAWLNGQHARYSSGWRSCLWDYESMLWDWHPAREAIRS